MSYYIHILLLLCQIILFCRMDSMEEIKESRFGFIGLIFIIFMLISVTTRSVLLINSIDMVDITIVGLLKIYFLGAFYDFVSVSYLIIPFVIYLFLLPKRVWNHTFNRYITYSFTYILLFLVVFYAFAEWFFWDEFSVRFNFIAVDYLVYTTEVIGNIRESYPLEILIPIIAFIASGIFYLLYKLHFIEIFLKDKSSFKQRVKPALILLTLPILFFMTVTQDFANISKNQYNKELSKTGLYSLFGAFRNNTLDYDNFYITMDNEKLVPNLKNLLDIEIPHRVINNGKEKNYNVMLIVVESLSGKFIKALGAKNNLTPKLNKLIDKSIFFSNFYATGTRTVRGMESITLSLPPTAGRSIVKRPDNHNMFSSGFIFKNRGYDTKFIYGGHGYFDNMNDFFSHNGFEVVDRTDFSDEEDSFHTVWGVCDEDLLSKVIKEADKSYKRNKPFMNFIMTTSNHRPYDFPSGKIDIPSHSGRSGAVKYTDYAIGDFIEKAKKKPWFKNTIFVIVADHCSSSAGRTELPLDKYHIPLIIYAPEIFQPQVIGKISSQIDIMPTLFSMLNWSYKSKFYGKDILNSSFKQRALIGTYQKLGLYKENKLTILSPTRKIASYEVVKQNIFGTTYKEIEIDKKLKDEIITYYQGASFLHKNRMDRLE